MASGEASPLNATVTSLSREDPATLSALAEPLSARLHLLDDQALEAVAREAGARPRRWAHALRQVLDDEVPTSSLLPVATLLETVGEQGDVARLRGLSRALRSRQTAELGRELSRRTASRLFVEDIGRVRLRIGGRSIHGTAIRRKVLALLTFLLTKPDLSATRDQVIDALWPDADPNDAANSLNQTVYFLRRTIEPSYEEDLSPGFVHHKSDVLWLDADLVDSRSRQCRRLVVELSKTRDPMVAEQLTLEYKGRFALDFEYEDWADAYRDALHAAFLEATERQVRTDLEGGHYDRGIRLARRALQVEPHADSIEAALVRLYDLAGAHSAAAEQQSRYAASNDVD
jgi:DNA-binding SARP family transcriptional activator